MAVLIDLILALMTFVGAGVVFLAAVRLVLAADPYARIEAAAKGAAVGTLLLLMAVAIAAGDFAVFMRALAAAMFVLMNALMIAVMLAERAGRSSDEYFSSKPQSNISQREMF